MESPICYIVDVGHGNATVLSDSNGVLIVDAGIKQKLLQFLLNKNVTHVECIIISHADYDHVAGIIDLLLEPSLTIGRVYLNPDPSQKSDTWIDITVALKEARVKHGTYVVPSAHSGESKNLGLGLVNTSILSPDETSVLRGIGSKDVYGNKIDRHSLNVVVCFEFERKVVMLLGDVNNNGLDFLEKEIGDLSADIIVFPHHGGRPGNQDAVEFTKRVCDMTKASHVIFSVASMRDNHPRQDIVEYINDNMGNTTMWSTGDAKPLLEIIEATDNCQHMSGVNNIKICFANNPVTIEPS